MWKRSKVFVINTYRLTYYRYNLIKYDWSKAWDRWWNEDPKQCVQNTGHVHQAPAQVPFMITKAMKEELHKLQYTAPQIDTMTPVQAQSIIKQQINSSEYDTMCDVTSAVEQIHAEIDLNDVTQSNVSRSESISDLVKDKLSTGSFTVSAASDNASDTLDTVCDPSHDTVCDPSYDTVCDPSYDTVCDSSHDTVCDPSHDTLDNSPVLAEPHYNRQSLAVLLEDNEQSAVSGSSIVLQANDNQEDYKVTSTKVPFFITNHMKHELLDRGYTTTEINKLAPGQAHAILSNKPESPDIQQTN